MLILDMLVLALAARAVMTAWFKEDGLFTNTRSYYEALRHADTTNLTAKLLTCPTCMAYHVAAWLACFCLVPSILCAANDFSLMAVVFKFPLYVLAAVAVIHLLEWLHPVKT